LKKKSLASLTLLYAVGNLSSKVMSFVLVFFVTFYLTTQELGEFDLLLIAINLLTPFVSFQLSDSALRWLLNDQSVENISKIFSTISVIILISLLCFSIIIFLYNYFIPTNNILYIYILVFLQSFNLFFLQCIRGKGDNKSYVLNGVINTGLYIGLGIFFLTVIKLKIVGLIYANIIALFISTLILLFGNGLYKYYDNEKISLVFAKDLLRYSLPLVPNSLNWWAISSANRYIILLYLGAAANGVFAIAYKLPSILIIFVNIFFLAWQERAITTHQDDDRNTYYKVVLDKYIRILFSISILIVSLNKILLSRIVSEEFFSAWEYTPVLLLSVIFRSLASFYGAGYLTSKKTSGAFFSSVFGGVVTVGSSFILIPQFGLHGSGLAICIGYFTVMMIRLYHTKNIFTFKFPMKSFLRYLILFVFTSILNYFNFTIVTANLFFVITLLLIINKDLLLKSIMYLKSLTS
jgi:O-antigen/teichoic acid export membrane protein